MIVYAVQHFLVNTLAGHARARMKEPRRREKRTSKAPSVGRKREAPTAGAHAQSAESVSTRSRGAPSRVAAARKSGSGNAPTAAQAQTRVAASRVGANTCPPMVFPAVLHFTSEPGGRLGELPEASRARHLRGSFPRSRGWNASVSGLLSGSGRDLTRRAAQCAASRKMPLKSQRDLAPADELEKGERFPPLFPKGCEPRMCHE